MKFEEWLIAQQSRQDLIGDLARVLSSHNGAEPVSRRKPDEHRVWADIVIRNASPDHVVIFNDAWQEFQLAKEATRESTD
jgi:hypothetical protein